MEHRFENGMDPYASLSPGSALFLLMLSRAGACPRKALPLFMGRGADTSAILAELSRKGLIDCAPGREIRPTGERMGAELLEGRTYSSQDWPEDSLAFCVAAHLEGRDLRFLQAARALLESLCYGPHSSLFAIAYAALGASLARLRPGQAGRADSADSGDDADRAGYADLVRLLTDIQRLAVHMCLNIEAVHAVFTRMRAAAAEIGDRRTLARTDLAEGMLGTIAAGTAEAAKNHALMRGAAEEIFAIGDSDIVLQSADMLSFHYLLRGSSLVNSLFWQYARERMPDTRTGRSILIRVSLHAALGEMIMGGYLRAGSMLESCLPFLETASPVERTLVHAALGRAATLSGRFEEARLRFETAEAAGSARWHVCRGLLEIWRMLLLRAQGVLPADIPAQVRPAFLRGAWALRLIEPELYSLMHCDAVPRLFRQDRQAVHATLRADIASPFTVPRAAAMRARAVLLHEAGHWDEARDLVVDSQRLSREYHAFIEYSRGCLVLAGFYHAEGLPDRELGQARLACGLCRHFGQPPWPKRYAEAGIEPFQAGSLSFEQILCRNFFLALRHQDFRESGQSFDARLLRALLAAFPLERGLVARPENGVWIASAAEGGPAGEVSAGSFAEGGHAARAFEKNTVEFAFRDVPPEHGGPGLLEVGIYFSVHFEDIGCFVYLEGLVPESHRSMFDTAFFNILRSFIISQAVSARYEERLAGRAERADQTGHAGRAAPACAAKGAPERDDGGFACASAVMCRLMDQADRIAPRDTTVLLLGESGVGKEVMARRIHEKSGRTGPFVGVSLAGTPQELFESEFCGHEKGSFTGAASRKKGLLELADGGTLFIDEAGDIPMALQVKLLRLLQEKTFMRVGGTRLISSDFRLVAATNRNLREMVRDGSFREDLYYRLNVVPLNIPPLRERPEDILFLAGRFLERFSARHELPLRPFPAALTARMLKAPWPGNVRQLRNFVERWCLYADSSQVLDADMEETGAARRESAAGAPAAVKAGPGAPPADPQAPVPAAVSPADGADSVFAACPSLRELTDRYFEYVYTRKNGVLSGRDSVAATLGISKPTAHSWASRLKLREKYRLTVAAGRKEEDGGS